MPNVIAGKYGLSPPDPLLIPKRKKKWDIGQPLA
jgi:hypothetical protein